LCEEYLLHLFSGIGSGIYSVLVEAAVTFHISPSQNFQVTGSGIYSVLVEAAVTFHISPSQNFQVTGLVF
jgi:hypothetical protein